MPKFRKDAPSEERAPLSFLLGLRWQLDQWGYDTKFTKVDENSLTMKFNGKIVARVTVQSDKLAVEWLDPEWKDWKELNDSNEFKAPLNANDKKLQHASENKLKGKGKGKDPTAQK